MLKPHMFCASVNAMSTRVGSRRSMHRYTGGERLCAVRGLNWIEAVHRAWRVRRRGWTNSSEYTVSALTIRSKGGTKVDLER